LASCDYISPYEPSHGADADKGESKVSLNFKSPIKKVIPKFCEMDTLATVRKLRLLTAVCVYYQNNEESTQLVAIVKLNMDIRLEIVRYKWLRRFGVLDNTAIYAVRDALRRSLYKFVAAPALRVSSNWAVVNRFSSATKITFKFACGGVTCSYFHTSSRAIVLGLE
jgi:hypothetical protein